MTEAARAHALSDVRVVDLSGRVAGQFCTKMLAHCGAEVIKVEPPAGDALRRRGPFPDDQPDPDASGLFLHLNAGKKSVTLDVTTPTGRRLLKRLLAQADVLVESHQPGELSQLGLGYDDLQDEFPDLVYTSITPFGQTGPYRDYKGDSIAAQALCSYAYTTGDPEREPLATAGDLAEYFAGAHGAVAVTAAIEYRSEHGGGQQIDLSILESIAMADDYNYACYAATGAIRRRYYSRLLMSYPNDIYRCKDGYITFAPGATGFPMNVALLLDRPELADHPLFVDANERQIRWREFDAIVQPWLLEHTVEEVLLKAQSLRMLFAPVPSPPDLLSNVHLEARGFFGEVEQPGVGRFAMVGPPFEMSATPLVRAPAPGLGEHNAEQLVQRLTLEGEELLRLRSLGIA